MKYFKIHPNVSCCAYKHGVLHDKNAVYPETQWTEGEALERVKKGFLIEVKKDEPEVEKQQPEIKKIDIDSDSGIKKQAENENWPEGEKKEDKESERFKNFKKNKHSN